MEILPKSKKHFFLYLTLSNIFQQIHLSTVMGYILFFFFNPSLQILLVLTLICELNKVFDRCLFYINIKS